MVPEHTGTSQNDTGMRQNKPENAFVMSRDSLRAFHVFLPFVTFWNTSITRKI